LAKNWSRKNAKNTREVAYIFAFLAFSCGYSLWLRHKPRWVQQNLIANKQVRLIEGENLE